MHMSARIRRRVLRGAISPLLALVLVVALGGPGRAEAQQPAPPPAPPLHLSADHVSGSHGPEGDIVTLSGNVKIVRGRTTITANDGTYDRANGMAYLQHAVRIVDSTTVITCDEASYSENDDVVQLSGHVRATDRNATLEAPSATYDRLLGQAELFGGVTGHYRRNQRMLSDRATYDRDSMVVHARGNVRGFDDENHVTLFAREVDYDRSTDEAEARGAPALEERGED